MKLNNPGCSCCGRCPCECTLGCGQCTTMPKKWTFPVAGVSNSGCSECADYNSAEWTLCHTSGCEFTTERVHGTHSNCGAGTTYHWKLDHIGASSVWRLTALDGDGGVIATYELADGSFNCANDTANTLSKVSNSGDCTGWPASITLTPCAGCPLIGDPCSHCSGDTQKFYKVTISGSIGTTGYADTDCPCECLASHLPDDVIMQQDAMDACTFNPGHNICGCYTLLLEFLSVSGPNVRIKVTLTHGNDTATYWKDVAGSTINCTSLDHTLTYQSASGTCTGYNGLTIRVRNTNDEPVPRTCSHCGYLTRAKDPDQAGTVIVTLSDWTENCGDADNQCDCTELSGAFGVTSQSVPYIPGHQACEFYYSACDSCGTDGNGHEWVNSFSIAVRITFDFDTFKHTVYIEVHSLLLHQDPGVGDPCGILGLACDNKSAAVLSDSVTVTDNDCEADIVGLNASGTLTAQSGNRHCSGTPSWSISIT